MALVHEHSTVNVYIVGLRGIDRCACYYTVSVPYLDICVTYYIVYHILTDVLLYHECTIWYTHDIVTHTSSPLCIYRQVGHGHLKLGTKRNHTYAMTGEQEPTMYI